MIELLMLAVLMIFVAAASGFVGTFALQKRMSLVGDAFSHVALPGFGLAILIHANPLYGGILAMILGAIIIWALQEKSRLPVDNVVGIIFITSLALGALLTPQSDLVEALFGGATSVTLTELAISVLLATIVILVMYAMKERLTLMGLSQEISKSLKIPKSFYNFLYLLFFSLTVVLGLKFLGVMLMGALIIIPASISKLFSWNQKSDIILSQVFAIACVLSGLAISTLYSSPLGPTIVMVCFTLFIIGLASKQVLSFVCK